MARLRLLRKTQNFKIHASHWVMWLLAQPAMIRQNDGFMRFSDAINRPLFPSLLEQDYMQECKIKDGRKRIDPLVLFKATTTIRLEKLVACKVTQEPSIRSTKASP